MKNEHKGKETRVIHYGQIERRKNTKSERKSKERKRENNPYPPAHPHMCTYSNQRLKQE